MSRPIFLLQIVRADAPHDLVRFPGGGPLERDFITACTEAIVRRGVGFMKTEAKVKAAIQAGVTDAIMQLKLDTKSVV